MKQKGLLILLLILGLASAVPTPKPVHAAKNNSGGQTQPLATNDGLALAQFLDADGGLNLPPEGILGSINPAGYQLASAPGEAPRFAPTAPTYATDNANWDPRFASLGMNGNVWVLAWDGTNLYAGGFFTSAGGVAANRIARWDGSTWSALGSGMDGAVFALAWDGTGLYAGGQFTNAGGVPANRIARWNGSTWSALGAGMNNSVRALAWDGTSLYAGGQFTSAGGVAANRIARWNGSTWSALGAGMNGNVESLAWDGTNLYAGGGFSTPFANIARWNGSTWSGLGTGTNGRVIALVWSGTDLYAGGLFNITGGVSATRIARWNGSTWSAVGAGVDFNLYALAWDGSNLYAGGQFTNAGGIPANYVARWNGATWSALGSGMDNAVQALAWDGTSLYNSLYVGGLFTTAGTKPSSNIGRWRLASVWDGGGADNNGSTAANWSGDVVPLTTDVAIFDSTSSKQALLDASFPASLRGLIIEDSYGGVVTQSEDFALTNDLQIHGGTFVVADPAAHSFTVGGTVQHTGGTLQQTRPVNSAAVPFLQIENGAAAVKYRGVGVDTTASAADLGDTKVTVRAIDTGGGAYCTNTGAGSPAYAKRCYAITPATNGAATVRLWALNSELNGIAPASLAVYRNNPAGSGTWLEQTTGASTGNDGGAYSYAQGEVAGFSPFLLGQTGQTPTAVTLAHLSADSSAATDWLIGLALMLMAGSGLWYLNHKRQTTVGKLRP